MYSCEPCPPVSAQGRLYAEISLLEFSVLSPTSQGYRPGIDCLESVKGLGTVSESLAVGRPKPGLSFLLLLHSHILAIRGEAAGQPRGTYFAELSTLPTAPTIEYDCKLEILFWLGIFKIAFRLFGVHIRRRPVGQGQGRSDILFAYCLR